MESKKELKMKLSTVLYLVIILILIMGIGITYYFGIIKNNEKIQNLEKTYSKKIENLEKEKNELKEKLNRIETNNAKTPGDNNYIENENMIDNETIEFPIDLKDDVQEKTYLDFYDNNLNFEKYFISAANLGDYSTGYIAESNYEQYIKGSVEVKPYNSIINIKFTLFDNWIGNCASYKGYNEEIDIYNTNKTIEEKTKELAEIYNKCHDVTEELHFKVTGMVIMNGKNVSEEEYYNNARAKKIKLIYNDKIEKIIELEDTMEIQVVDLDYKQNDVTKPIDIKIEVLEKYSGKVSNDVYITDIQFGGYFSGSHGI